MRSFIPYWLSVLLLLNTTLRGQAQTQPVNCTSQQIIVPPTTYQGWDWETTPFQANYCNTWASYTKTRTGTGGNTLQLMGSPWNKGNSRILQSIGERSDYKRADGWELVRLDFGGYGGTYIPNFILYNKYTGILRVFAWLNSTQTFSGAIMTMASVAGSQSNAQVSSVSGLSQPLLRAADKYQAQNQGDDLTTYICSFGGSQGWIMGEFTMLFDPNHTDPKYYESKLEFKVYGIVRSTVVLGGDFRFTTQPAEGFGFSGAASQIDGTPGSGPNGAKTFLATGTKFLGKFANLSDQLGVIHDKAQNTADGLGKVSGPLLGIKKTSEFVAKLTGKATGLIGAFKGILGVTSQANAVFGLLGSVAGLLWPDEQSATAAAPPAPTVSTGSINLKGSIETSTLLGETFYMQVPGTPHNFNSSTNGNVRSSQPYFDCPMGLFNLRRTPQLRQIISPRATQRSGNRGSVPEQNYTSYQVVQNLEPVFNQLAGIQVVSVKAAIVQKVRYSSLASLFPASGYNLMYAQVAAGNLEAVPYDAGPTGSAVDDTYLVQTPFVEVGCFQDMAFNAPTDSLAKYPAFVRVVATLRRTNAPASAAPIYFTQDYAFDVPTTTFDNPSYLDIYGYLPYFNGVGILNPLDVQYSGVVFQQYGQFFSAPSQLGFDSYSSLTMDLVRNGGSQGYGGPSGGFRAGTSIGFSGILNIPAGMEVEMTTNQLAGRTCSNPGLTAQAAGTCNGYNPWATTSRQAPSTTGSPSPLPTKLEAVLVQLSPNPATGSTIVHLFSTDSKTDAGLAIERVELLNANGQALWRTSISAAGIKQVAVPLQGIVPGFYFVRVTASERTYSAKLLVN